MSRCDFLSRRRCAAFLGRFAGPTTWLFIPIALVMWLSFVTLPSQVAGVELDQSWHHAYGYFFKNNFQAGKDYIFTQGPLGCFWTDTYDADVFWYRYAWELTAKFVFVMIIMRTAAYFPGLFTRLAFCATFVVLAVYSDLYYIAAILLVGVLAVKSDTRSWPRLAAVALFLAVLSLLKFTFFILSVIVLLCVCLNILGGKRPRAAPLPFALFAVAFTLLWLALGQSPVNLPRFLFGSLQVAAGYGEAMTCEGNPNELYVAGLALLCLGAALLPFATRKLPVGVRRLVGLRQFSRLGLLGAAVFLEWKHGFVRQDGGHTLLFFSFLLYALFLLPILFPTYDWRTPLRVRLTTACFFLSLIGFTMTAQVEWTAALSALPDFLGAKWEYAVNPSDRTSNLGQQRAEKENEYSLPLIKERVAGATVDMLTVEQGVIFLNQLNWRPRPVFQSYSAYTPYLLSANALFFRSERAPQYVLFKPQTIDDRFPTLDDGPALLVLFQRYRPVLVENGYLLLQHRRHPETEGSLAGKVVLEKRVRFGDKVDLGGLPGRYHTLALKIRPSWWGRLRKALYKPPEVSLQVRTHSSREPLTYRLIPAMAEEGFLLNPLLLGQEDVINLYGHDHAAGKAVTSFRITTSGPGSYEDEITVTIKSYPNLVGPGIGPAERFRMRHPGESDAGAAIKGAPRLIQDWAWGAGG